jgi:hypothetical protein
MSKRQADGAEDTPLKGGGRPDQMDVDSNEPPKDMGEFEDEFEDEFESEDEIFEAGVDGRPDAEREAEEKRECLLFFVHRQPRKQPQLTNFTQRTPWTSTKAHLSSAATSSSLARPLRPT